METGRLGQVTAVIQLATANFERARQVIVQQSQQIRKAVEAAGTATQQVSTKMGAGLGKVADGFERARSAADKFNKTSLGRVGQELQKIQTQLAAISVAAGAFTALGVQSARSVRQTEAQFRVLLGSQEKASAEMARLSQLARELNAPMGDTLEAAAGMIPLVKSTGAEFTKLITVTEKLARLDPFQGRQGARIALQEFLSGDVTSIFRRFELGVSRDEFRSVVDAAQGDANRTLEGLERILDRTGLTTDALKELNAADPFPRFADTLKRAMATAFTPFLEKVLIPIVEGLTQFIDGLNQTNPELLALGGALAATVAVGAPLLIFLNQAIIAMKALGAASAMTGFSVKGAVGGIGRAVSAVANSRIVGTGLAVAGGVVVGGGIAQGMANAGMRSGDLGRIASKESGGGGENVMDVLGERVKQIIVILMDGVIHIVKVFMHGATFIGNAINQFANIFRWAGALFGELFGRLQMLFADLNVGLADALSGLFDTTELRNIGKLQKQLAESQINTSMQEREFIQSELSRGFALSPRQVAGIDSAIDDIRKGVLGPLTNMLFPAAIEAGEQVPEVQEAIQAATQATIDSAEYLEQQAQDIADEMLNYTESVAQINDEYAENRAKVEQDYQDELVKIADDAIKAQNKALEDLVEERAKLALELGRDEQDALRDAERERLDMAIEAQRDERDAYQAHLKKLEEIRQKAQESEAEALLNFDFKAVFESRRKTSEALSNEVGDFAQERNERAQALADERDDLQRSLEQERQDRLIAYQRNQEDAQAAYQREMAQIQVQQQEKLLQAQQAHQVELAQLQTAKQQELQILFDETKKRMDFISRTEAEITNIQRYQLQQRLGQARAIFGTTQAGAVPPRTVPLPPVMTGSASGGMTNRMVATRAEGGWLNAYQTSIVNEGFAGQMERFVSGGQSVMLAGGMGMFTPFRAGMVEANAPSNTNQQIAVHIHGAEMGGVSLEQAAQIASERVVSILSDWSKR